MTRTKSPHPPGKVTYMRIPVELHIHAERIAIGEDRNLHSALRALIWDGIAWRRQFGRPSVEEEQGRMTTPQNKILQTLDGMNILD
jgi:hypothetical protein